MTAFYDFRPKPNPNKEDEEIILYPRVVIKDTINKEKLIKKVADRSTFSEGEVGAVLGLVNDTIIEYIKEGYSVESGRLGFFTPTLTSRPVKDKKEIRSWSIKMSGLNFRASKYLKRELSTATLERAKYGFNQSSEKFSIEERKALLDTYIKENHFITRREYSVLTGLLKDRALNDLNNWIQEGFLKTRGARNMRIYLRNTENNENLTE